MQCTLEIYLSDDRSGRWQECATIEMQDSAMGTLSPTALYYDVDYVFNQNAPISLRHAVKVGPVQTPHWPAFLFDLLPQGHGRKYLLGELEINDGPAADWPLLCAGAFNPIGRLRIKEAVDYYQAQIASKDPGLVGKGFTIDEIQAREEDFIEHLQIHGMLSSGTSGVQGVAPKFLITQGKDDLWYADGALPDHLAAKHYLVKLPRGKDQSDRKVLRNEAAYMQVAQKMGLQVDELPTLRGDMLFIPRFDRAVNDAGVVLRHHQESAAALAGQIGFDSRPSQYQILAALRAHTDHAELATIEFLKRDVLNLALGNTDNHGRNTAVQRKFQRTMLTPLFDFAPMYLDKEGIPRALRWRTPDKIEQTNWVDVFHQLPATVGIDQNALSIIRQELHKFASTLEALEEVMAIAGVDDDIITRRHYDIVGQIQQLQELGTLTSA